MENYVICVFWNDKNFMGFFVKKLVGPESENGRHTPSITQTHIVDPPDLTLYFTNVRGLTIVHTQQQQQQLRGLSPQANYTDRAAAAGRRS